MFPDQNGSSTPFHIAIALLPGSAFSEPTTCCSRRSPAEPAVAVATVLRFTQVERPFAAAAWSSAFAAVMSAGVHGVVAGPIFSIVTPAAATAA